MPPNWSRLFPDCDFRHAMGLQAAEGRRFFAPSASAEWTLELRANVLGRHPAEYAVLPEGLPDVAEALEIFALHTRKTLPDAMAAGVQIEQDWVVLVPDAAGIFRVAAGIVCFPSSWSLPAKAGQTLMAVHDPVPELNESLGRSIDTFLQRLAVGAEWGRENWALSPDDALDHHPRHGPRLLPPGALLEDTWLRLEQQYFTRLAGGAVLFAIRVSNHRLDQLAAMPELAPRMARTLATMSEATALYKGFAQARGTLIAQLNRI